MNTQSPTNDPDKVILVVDDDPDSMNGYVEFLKMDYGHKFVTACDGRKGLEAYRENKGKVVLIITDNSMPNMTGREWITQLRNEGETIPVLMISGDHEVELKRWARDNGVTFVPKPIDFDRFLDAVQAILAQH